MDIGVFVSNGKYYSPPAFVTFYSLDNEQRVYDKSQRIQSVVYSGADEPGNYTDPLVALPKSWRDDYHYDAAGSLSGWTRHRGSQGEEFTPAGRLIVRRDEHGKPLETSPVRYIARLSSPAQLPVIVEKVGD